MRRWIGVLRDFWRALWRTPWRVEEPSVDVMTASPWLF